MDALYRTEPRRARSRPAERPCYTSLDMPSCPRCHGYLYLDTADPNGERTDAAWGRVLKEKERELAQLADERVLVGRRKGRRLLFAERRRPKRSCPAQAPLSLGLEPGLWSG